MEIIEYYNWVQKELKNTSNNDNIIDMLNCSIGLMEESCEFVEIIDCHKQHSEIRTDKLFMEEFGDFSWYLVAMFHLHYGDKGHEMLSFLINVNLSKDTYFHPNVIMVKSGRIIGKFKKILFLGKEYENERGYIEDSLHEIVKEYVSIIVYLRLNLNSILEENYKKLNDRYPDGRKLSYKLELNKILLN